jgi:RHS repeat-associated protein
MKIKWFLLAVAALALLIPREVRAGGACTAARFHDWNDMGCNQNYAGAGSPASPKSCSDCGMPRWWVSEPYISLWMSDTPLSYATSSGQTMDFQFYYRQHHKLPDDDEIPNFPLHVGYYLLSTNTFDPEGYFRSVPTVSTNSAFWGNNWMQSLFYWNAQFDTNFANGYQVLLFNPNGGINSFYDTNYLDTTVFPFVRRHFTALTDPRSQAKLVPPSNLPSFKSGNYAADTNGIYWGSSTNFFSLNYPDGSKDVFGLNAGWPTGEYYTFGAYALLTQRVDPQGRVTRIGYELAAYPTNGTAQYYALRVRYVVDTDGRTNTFLYSAAQNVWQMSEIDDPFGRKAQFTYNTNNGNLASIIDAVQLTNTFAYHSNGVWLTNLATPYGNTVFNIYEQPDASVTDGYQQRVIYISEPAGAQQLYGYIHNSSVSLTDIAPTGIPGQSFDDGNSGTPPHNALTYRDSFHWGRRQFATLPDNLRTNMSGSLSNVVNSLTGNTTSLNLARMRHWLLGTDLVSVTESLSSERDPSPTSDGGTPGLRTWYNYAGKSSAEVQATNVQVGCIARLLPDGSSQFTTYNYYPTNAPAGAGLVSDNESSYSLPDGSIGVLTNSFTYSTNSVDLLSVSNSAGQFVNCGYNSYHQVVLITNSLNQVTTNTWDAATHNLTCVQTPGGGSVNLSYYATSSVPTSTSAMLQQVNFQPEGRTNTINSYSAGLPASITDDRGLTVTSTWDGLNRLTGVGFPDNTTVSNIYSRLDLVAAKDRLGNWSYFSFDGLQHLLAVTNANNAVTTYSWCGCGSLESIVDALTNQTTLHYDNQNNLTNVIYPDTSTVTWQFDIAGRMTNSFDGAGRYLQLVYNNQGLPISVAGANGTLQTAIFDALNRPVSVTDANGVTVTNQFDAINRLLKRAWPDAISEGYGYSDTGLVAFTNRDQQITRYGRDAAGRLLAETNANLEVTRFGYNSLDQTTDLWDGNNSHVQWQFNQYGWLTNKIDGLGRNAFRYLYNANGWVTNRWTPEKGITAYALDNVGNLTNIAYPQVSIAFAFDAVNRLTGMMDAVGTTAFTYTPAGQLAGESNAWTTVGYSYQQGLQTQLTIAQPGTNWAQNYFYDLGSRLTNTVSPAGGFAYSYNFQPASVLFTGIQLPNGAKIVNSYDSLARLTGTALNNYWGHTLDSSAYIPDALGLRTNIVRNLGLTSSTVAAGFDNIGQLTSWNAVEAGGTPRQNEQLGFGYDAAHNLHTRNNGGLSQTFTTDTANQLNSVTRSGTFTLTGATPAPATNVTVNGQAAQTYGDFTFAATNNSLANGANTFTIIAQNAYGVTATNSLTLNLPSSVALNYDQNGNLTNDGVKSFAFDAENQLTNITLAGQWRSDFVYDGLNRRRIARDYAWQGGAWVQTNEVRYVYDGNLIIQERDSNNVPLVTYTRGLDLSDSLHGAGGIGGLLARTDGSGSAYYHADGSGNVTALIDAQENIVGRYLYNPFGKLTGQWGSLASANTMQFSSMPQLHGLSFYTYRAYDPNLQRWLNSDPIQEAGGINLTMGMGNNPINFADPLGLETIKQREMLLEELGETDVQRGGRESAANFAKGATALINQLPPVQVYTAATGKDALDRKVSGTDRGLAIASIAPVGKGVGLLGKLFNRIRSFFKGKKALQAAEEAKTVAQAATDCAKTADAAESAVKITRPGGGVIYGEIANVGKIHAVIYGDTLWIENITVNQGSRLQGNSVSLYEAVLKEAPGTTVIRGEAGGVNLEVLKRTGNINLTPRARALNQLGFTKHEYDAVNNVMISTKP